MLIFRGYCAVADLMGSPVYQESINYLVAETLGSNNGNLVADALVGLEIESELGVVPLNDDLGGLLDGLGANATHFGGG